MDGVAKLMPEMKKSLALDSTKRCLIEFWDECSGKDIEALMCKLILWMEPFNVKISILIRSGFQRNDGTFETTPQSHLQVNEKIIFFLHFYDLPKNVFHI